MRKNNGLDNVPFRSAAKDSIDSHAGQLRVGRCLNGSIDIAEQAAIREVELLEKRGDALTHEDREKKQALAKALHELRIGIGAAERLVLERCKMHQPSALAQ